MGLEHLSFLLKKGKEQVTNILMIYSTNTNCYIILDNLCSLWHASCLKLLDNEFQMQHLVALVEHPYYTHGEVNNLQLWIGDTMAKLKTLCMNFIGTEINSFHVSTF